MRKNLHYKVLASVLAIAGLYFYNAPAAWADIQKVPDTINVWEGSGTITGNKINNTTNIPEDASIYGKYNSDNDEDANGNKITINGSTLSKVSGAISKNNNVTNNEVTINNSNIQNVYGGESESGTASGNKVLITNTENPAKEFYKIIGGSTISKEATGNTVTINGNVTLEDYYSSYIAGGVGSGGSTVSDNHVIIEGGTVKGNIYGGYGYLNSNALIDKNDITITDSANVAGANLYGGYANSNTATISNNKLIIDGWSGSVGSLKNFDFIDFENIDISKNTTLTSDNISFINTPTITIKSIKADDLKLSAGDYKKDSKINLSNISWSAGLGNNVMVDGSVNETLSALSDYYTTDNADNGIYVNKFKLNHEIDKDNYQVNFSANVDKSILTGKFIDKNGAHFNSKQTEETAALTISDGFTTEVGTVAGAYAASGNNATGGKLIISGNTDYDKDLYGAYAENGNAEKSTVEISGDTNYKGTVYAGYSEKGEVKDNTINVSKNIKANNMSLSGSNTTTAAGTLSITGNGSEFNNISNFETINFNDVALNSNAALTIASADVDDTTINVKSLEGGNNYHGGESVTLLKSANAITGTGNVTITNDIVTAGLIQDLHISTAQSADNTSIDLYVKDVSMNEQINLVAENRAVAAAFVNQGTDLISDSLDTLSRDGSYGVKTFAAVHGNRSKYDVNSDLKINGWSTIVGVGNAAEFADGDEFSWGVFYENGSGNYRTYNEFNNEFFRGVGSLVYNGGGIAARYENKNGVYTEGSLRAGMLKNELDNAMRNVNGSYGYETESAYYGAHIGVGKIISLSDSSDLDIYGKFFHTYTEGDSVTIAGDKFDFDSITSDRLRVGARITSNKENKFSTYYGLAYEYEFNGDADMTAQGLRADTQSLQGSSVMAEVGFNYQPTPTSPWSFDLNMRGYAGERQGGSFNVQATYTF